MEINDPTQPVTITSAASETGLVIEIQPVLSHSAEIVARIARVWDELRASNDRYYDGPILRVLSVDAEAGRLLCRRDTFRSLAVSARLGLGVRQLGVCGIVVGRDHDGQEHILLARRAADTRIYPGLWELAPSGGVKPPPPNVSSIGTAELALALAEEAEEELGLELDRHAALLIAFLKDDLASSHDAVMRIDLPTPIDPRRATGFCSSGPDRWEYLDSAWIALADLPAFTRDHAAAIAPPTTALLRWLGWT